MNVCPGYTTSIVVSLLGNRLMQQVFTLLCQGRMCDVTSFCFQKQNFIISKNIPVLVYCSALNLMSGKRLKYKEMLYMIALHKR
jgi:hypothetical protein